MDNLNQTNIGPVDGSMEVPVSEAGKILKASGYKVSNSGVEAFVSLKDINKIYPNGVQAVYDFNIDIDEHDFIVLVGPSGCGKSTTLRMIAGLEEITSGYLYIDKVLSNYTSSKDRDISMVFQNYALYPQMTVYDNIAFPLRARKYKRPIYSTVLRACNAVLDIVENRAEEYVVALNEAKNKALNFGTVIEYIATKLKVCDDAVKILSKYNVSRVEELMALKEGIVAACHSSIEQENSRLEAACVSVDEEYRIVKDGEVQYHYVKLSNEEIRSKVFEAAEILDLGPYLDRRPKELSGGQMQRVALGRAIVRNAKLFLMDEPLSNLDAKLRVQMRSEIVRIHEQIGATTIYVTHDQTEAMTMATKIVVMSKGWVQQIGTPQEIYYNPKNIFVATFIGSPAMNIFDAEYSNGTVTFPNGYSVKLSENDVEKHKKFYEERIADLERMLATPDFIKMKALKVVDDVLFKLNEQVDAQMIDKKINELLALVAKHPVYEQLVSLLAPFSSEETKSQLVNEVLAAEHNNVKAKFAELSEIVADITDNYGAEAQNLVASILEALNQNEVSSELNVYNEYLNAVNEAVKVVEELNDNSLVLVLAKLKALNIAGQLPKASKEWLLAVRRPLLTFEKIPSTDIGKLHNAQTFSKREIVVNDTLFYQKPKKKKKEVKVNVNLNSVDVEFVNNLYEVASELLARYKVALTGKHGIRVGIRPEDLHLSHEFDGNKTEGFNIDTNIVELLGSELLIHTQWAGANMIAKISTGTLVKSHTTVELTMNKDKILIFDESCGDTINHN